MARQITTMKHPSYSAWADKWDFFYQSYAGGEDYINNHLFQYFKEGDNEFEKRTARAYRENHTKRVVDLINSYLFKQDAVRKTENKVLLEVVSNLDGKGKSANNFMKAASQWASTLGRVYIIVDKPTLPEDEATGTQADNLKAKAYCYVVFPQNMMDIAFDDQGKVKWALIREYTRPSDDDPFNASDQLKPQYRLWEVGKWTLYDENGKETEKGDNGLDIVPIVILDSEELEDYAGQPLISDIAYIDRAIFNNWSRLDTIVCDQTFSQLIFPVEGLPADIAEDKDLREQFLTLATNRVILYSAQAQAPPQFISPDASQAEFILNMIEKQTKQLYASLGLQNETATEQKGGVQSGVSKAFDFDKLNKLLATKASNLEQAEKDVYEIVKKWGNITGEITVEYPDEFDVKSLADEIAIAQELALLNVSQTFTKEVQKNLVQKALPKASKETIQTINEEIDARQEPDEEAQAKAGFPFDKNKGGPQGDNQDQDEPKDK